MNNVLSALGIKDNSNDENMNDESFNEQEVDEKTSTAQKNAASLLANLKNNINIFFDKLELNESVIGVDYILLIRALCHNTTVRYVTIDSSFLGQYNTEEIRILLEIVGSMPYLEILTVRYFPEMALQAKMIAKILNRTTKAVKELHFHDLELAGDDFDMEPLGEALDKMKSLRSISLIGLGLEESSGDDDHDPISLDHIINSLSNLPALEKVEITTRRKLTWDDDSLGGLCDSNSLKSLKLGNMVLLSSQIASIAAALENNTALTHLHLNDCGMDGDGWRAIASCLPANKTLQHLDLSQCLTLDDDGCFVIGSCMEGNTALKSLRLQSDEASKVTSKGVTSLARMLEKNETLECLEMSFTASDDTGFKSVADALVRNTSLKRLYVENHGTAVSTKGVVAIGNALQDGDSGLEQIGVVFDGADSDGVLALAQAVEKSSKLKHFTFNRAEYRSYKAIR